MLLAVDHDLGDPLPATFVKPDAFRAAGVVGATPCVHPMVGTRGQPKIGDAIVGWIAIDVVDLTKWPFAVNIEPRQTVSAVKLEIDADHDIPALLPGFPMAGREIRVRVQAAGSPSPRPCEQAGHGVVVQQFSEPINREAPVNGLSPHAPSPVL